MQIYLFFSLRVKEDSAFHRGSSFLSVAEALSVDTLEDMWQTGKSKCTALPKLAVSCSPCNLVAASSLKDFFSPQALSLDHTSVLITLYPQPLYTNKRIPQDSHLEVVSEIELHF